MDRDNKNKLKLLRLLELLRQETDEQHPMTTEMICQRLSENGIGWERLWNVPVTSVRKGEKFFVRSAKKMRFNAARNGFFVRFYKAYENRKKGLLYFANVLL